MTRRFGLHVLLVATMVATIGCDRVTKRLATDALAGSSGRSYLADMVRLEYAENRGGFLSVGETLPPAWRQAVFVGGTGLLLLAVVGAAIRYPRREIARAGLAFFVAGGLSNLVDRVAHGRVVDFLVLRVGPIHTGVFNVADVAIMIGLALLVLAEMTRAGRPAGPGADLHPDMTSL